jgi:hypothetical protein
VCDDIRPLLRAEASALFHSGIVKGMISRLGGDGLPKYVWAVDSFGQAYEAKRGGETLDDYHGYRLPESDPQRRVVLSEWKKR